MKKFLPVILIVVGLIVVAAYFFIIRGRSSDVDPDEGMDVALKDRPVLSLVPRPDGHWLDMTVEKIKIKGAANMEYILIYTVEDDEGSRQQGVPGTLEINGQDKLTTELLLGSESRGNYRYDEGVERGTVTLRFRNKDGKLLAKFESRFRMHTATSELTSADGNLNIELEEETADFVVITDSIGIPGDLSGEPVAGPYGLYSSSTGTLSGQANVSSGDLKYWDGSWRDVGEEIASGVYVSL